MVVASSHVLGTGTRGSNVAPGREACLVAGACLAASISRLEAGAASARLRGIRVEDAESALHHVFHVVDLGATEVLRALRVNQDAHAALFEDDVVFFGRPRERHAVLVAATAPAG